MIYQYIMIWHLLYTKDIDKEVKMAKYKRIINGECNFQLIELFDDVEKAANNRNEGELVECKINNLKIDFQK